MSDHLLNGPSVSDLNTMPLTKVTDRDGRWYLRSGHLGEAGDLYVGVLSSFAIAGTSARELEPEAIEITYNGDADEITLPVEILRELLRWPA